MDIFIEKSSDFLQFRFCMATQLQQQAASSPRATLSALQCQRGRAERTFTEGHCCSSPVPQSRGIVLVTGTLSLSALGCQPEELAKAFQMRDDEFLSQSLILQVQTLYNP